MSTDNTSKPNFWTALKTEFVATKNRNTALLAAFLAGVAVTLFAFVAAVFILGSSGKANAVTMDNTQIADALICDGVIYAFIETAFDPEDLSYNEKKLFAELSEAQQYWDEQKIKVSRWFDETPPTREDIGEVFIEQSTIDGGFGFVDYVSKCLNYKKQKHLTSSPVMV
jgi:hypothetical protein